MLSATSALPSRSSTSRIRALSGSMIGAGCSQTSFDVPSGSWILIRTGSGRAAVSTMSSGWIRPFTRSSSSLAWICSRSASG